MGLAVDHIETFTIVCTSCNESFIIMKIFLVALAAIFLAGANGDTKGMNDLVDDLLSMIKPTLAEQLEPFKLPATTHGFSKDVLGISVHGEAKLYDGYLSGLSSIYRRGDVTMRKDGENDIFTGRLGLHHLKGQYRAHARFMNLGPKVTARITVNSVSVKYGIKQFPQPDKFPELVDFQIESIDGVKVKFYGLGPLGWILGGLTTAVVRVLKGVVSFALNTVVKTVISGKLKDIDFLGY